MQVLEHASDLGWWRVAGRAARPDLRSLVRGYVASSSVLPKPLRERHLPSPEVPLFLNFGAPHRQVDDEEPNRWVRRDGAWIVGLHERRRLSDAVGHRDFMVVRFTPLGAHLFLGAPMHLVTGRAVELRAIDPSLAARVMQRVNPEQSWDDRFDAIEALIAERVARTALPREVAWVSRRLEAADGRLRLRRILGEIDCSHRALIARFRTCIGCNPKTFARLLRFDRAMRTLNSLIRKPADAPAGQPYIESDGPEDRRAATVRWVDIAADCGYFDQSHFIRDFRRFAGAAPAEFVRQVSDVA